MTLLVISKQRAKNERWKESTAALNCFIWFNLNWTNWLFDGPMEMASNVFLPHIYAIHTELRGRFSNYEIPNWLNIAFTISSTTTTVLLLRQYRYFGITAADWIASSAAGLTLQSAYQWIATMLIGSFTIPLLTYYVIHWPRWWLNLNGSKCVFSFILYRKLGWTISEVE